jgi:hypothetical protein
VEFSHGCKGYFNDRQRQIIATKTFALNSQIQVFLF